MESEVCEVCGKESFLSSCFLCDKKVCGSCIDGMKGVCIACKKGSDIGLSGEGIKEKI